jgi:hypothetical protein
LCALKPMFMPANPFSPSNICLLLISAGLVVYLLFLWRFAKRNTASENSAASLKPVVRFAAIYAGYFAFLCMLAGGGFFLVQTAPPRPLLIFLPLFLSIVLLSTAKANGALHFLPAIPPAALIVIQSFRILVELLFLQFLKEGLLPEELSFHGRNYDLLIGVLALPVAYLFWRKHAFARKAGIAFNILGLLSLVNIFTIVIPSLPSSFRVYDPLYLPMYFPGVMIVFAASLAIYLHILSLKQLLAIRSIQARNESGVETNKVVVNSPLV